MGRLRTARRYSFESAFESLRWVLVILFVLVGVVTDPMVKVLGEGVYRAFWWLRRLFVDAGKALYRGWWWVRHLGHQCLRISQNFGCMVLDWIKARTGWNRPPA